MAGEEGCDDQLTRVAVVGAGPAGLAVLVAFSAAGKAATGVEMVCFEQNSGLGGQWLWSADAAARGEAYGAMYKNLWSNGPKECIEFPDYSFEEHFSQPTPSYPPREVILDYLRGRANKYDVSRWIRFRSTVLWVDSDAASGRLAVTTRDDAEKLESTELFDYVFVGSGTFNTPHMPEQLGLASFPGLVMHSRDVRDAARFAGQTVLLIGNGDSGVDLASQLFKYGAKSVGLSGRGAPLGFCWPDERVRLFPRLRELIGCTAFFVDDSSLCDIDVVVLCTGYQLRYPFMCPSLRLESTQRMWTDGLYAGVFLMSDPRITYLGTQNGWITFPLLDAQAWYARDVVLGRLKLPTRESMEAEFAKWRAREEALESDDEMIDFEAEYVAQLLAATDYPEFDIAGVAAMFRALEEKQLGEGIMTYRNLSHKSVVTGTMAPAPTTEWLSAWDDSIPVFLGAPGNVDPPAHRPLHSFRMVSLPEGHPNYDPSFTLSLMQSIPEGVSVAPTNNGLGLFATKAFRRGECMYKTNALAWLPPRDLDLTTARFVHITNKGRFESSAATHTSAKGETGGRWVYGFDAFMNHSCDPNTVSPPNASWFEENEDEEDYLIVAKHDITVGEEITIDYDLSEWHTDADVIEACHCGSACCRRRVCGFRSWPRPLQLEALGRVCCRTSLVTWLLHNPCTIYHQMDGFPRGARIDLCREGRPVVIASEKVQPGDRLCSFHAVTLTASSQRTVLLLSFPDPTWGAEITNDESGGGVVSLEPGVALTADNRQVWSRPPMVTRELEWGMNGTHCSYSGVGSTLRRYFPLSSLQSSNTSQFRVAKPLANVHLTRVENGLQTGRVRSGGSGEDLPDLSVCYVLPDGRVRLPLHDDTAMIVEELSAAVCRNIVFVGPGAGKVEAVTEYDVVADSEILVGDEIVFDIGDVGQLG